MLLEPFGSFFCINKKKTDIILIGDNVEKKKYNEIVNNHKPTETRLLNSIIAFVTGGLIGAFGQFLTECYASWFDLPTKDAVSFMLVTLIFIASLLTALGVFDTLVGFCRCGLIVPITGFAHSMTSAGIEYRKEGPIFGIGSNIFKLAGSVILYGVVAAWVFGSIRYIIMGG